ncbi:MAG TPA: BTAD domain-containing putative transcriptional regulator [Gemmatimonadales bacterium]|nr:BTAD domain-containing putative transcriptional regulator [Gemmatimonadales bacterium]
MYELLTLGGMDLWDDAAADPHPLLAHPKRFALLVYLALARPRVHRRSTLLALFWPELGAEHGRAALRQALHGLRRTFGPGAIRSRGDEEIRLDASLFRCDVIQFEEALAAGRTAEAVELYQGPLLPGFFVDGASGFERWLEDERARLRMLAVRAAWRLMADAEAAGDTGTAVVWARLAVHHSDHDEVSYRRLIGLLARMGDRAGAIATYMQLCRRLAHDFDCTPSAETESLLRTIRAHEPAMRPSTRRSRSVTRR